MTAFRPSVIVLGGPNGAGKSTVAPALLRDELAVTEFVNADVIAQGLSGFDADGAALAAGRIMLERIRALTSRHVSFAFESTLASGSASRILTEARRAGFSVGVIFLWLPSPEVAITRVRKRVEDGGHSVPEPTIRRRYQRGLENFFQRYRGLADVWRFYDNSRLQGPRLVARGASGVEDEIIDESIWERARSRS